MRSFWLLALLPAVALAQPSRGIDLTRRLTSPLVPYAQTDPRWAGFSVGPRDRVDLSVDPPVTIGRCGCVMASLATAADFLVTGAQPWFPSTVRGGTGFTSSFGFTPRYLDDYFNLGPAKDWAVGWGFLPGSGGAACRTGAYPWAASGLAVGAGQQAQGLTWTVLHADADAWAKVDKGLEAGRPSLLIRRSIGTPGASHANLVVGWDATERKYLLWDPMWSPTGLAQLAGTGFDGGTKDERYAAFWASVQSLFPLEVATSGSLRLLFVDDPEPIELRVTDPLGRRTGFDPPTGERLQEDLGAYEEVVPSLADPLGLLAPTAAYRYVAVNEPLAGTYGLEIFGTGTGPYTVTVQTSSGGVPTIHATLTGSVTPGAVQRYEVTRPQVGPITAVQVPAFGPRAKVGNGVIAYVGELVPFDGRGSYQIGGGVTDYQWTFGDDAGASGAQVTHAYASAGQYAARLTVRNDAGVNGWAERAVRILNPVPGETLRVSVTPDGGQANGGDSLNAVMTPDGRFVAFSSMATNLVPGDTNALEDVFVKDLLTGAVERVSVSSTGAQAASGPGVYGSSYPAISDDGRFVAFASYAPNLVPDDGSSDENAYVRDRLLGTTEAVSRTAAGVLKTGRFPSLSADGRFVAFESEDAIVPADDQGRADVYVRDRQTGSVQWVSVTSTGAPQQGDYSPGSSRPKLSANGRFVAFMSGIRNLVPDDVNGTYNDVFVRDLDAGVTELVSVGPTDAGIPFAHAFAPTISGDGRYVVFHADTPAYVPTDSNGTYDVFLRDRQLGTVELISVNSLEEQGAGPSFDPSVSRDGRYVAFTSRSANLAPGGTAASQLYLRDRQIGETSRVSVSTDGVPAQPFVHDLTLGSSRPTVADDGATAFTASAANLVGDDTNARNDIFLRRVAPTPASTTPIANLGGPYVGWATSAQVPAAVRFDGSASKDPQGRPLTATWSFGDGTPAQQAPLVTTHAYALPGRYVVTLTVAAGTATSTAARTDVEVLDALAPPQLRAPPCAPAGSGVTLLGAGVAANAALVATGWDRSAGRPALTDVAVGTPWGELVATPALPALTWQVTLAVPAGADAGAHALAVDGGATTALRVPCATGGARPPVAHAGGPRYRGTVGVAVTLDGTGSVDPEGASLTYAWDFGDGTDAGTGSRPSHVYALAGEYLVTLVVDDGTDRSVPTEGSRAFAQVSIAASADAGLPDAGGPPPDAGAGGEDAGGAGAPTPPVGCGCSSGDALVLVAALALVAVAGARRRPEALGVRRRA